MAKNPNAVEMSNLFNASFDTLVNEFVTPFRALKSAQKYRDANVNASYLDFCSNRVNLLVSLLQYYKKPMSDAEMNLKLQSTPEQVLHLIKTYIQNKQQDRNNIRITKIAQGSRKHVTFNPEIQDSATKSGGKKVQYCK